MTHSSPPRFLITGASGQLARAFAHRLHTAGIPFEAPSEQQLDITDAAAIERCLQSSHATAILNCAAFNDVEAAERDETTAMAVNATAVRHLARAAADRRLLLVHFSTDYVFDGLAGRCYVETDAPAPLNAYGRSKLMGEREALEAAHDLLLLRTSWVFGAGTQNFFHKLRQWAARKTELDIVNDQISVPTYTEDLVTETLAACEAGLRGLYHLTNSGVASRYETACLFFRLLDRAITLHPVPTVAFPSPVRRPLFSAMSNARLTQALGHPIPAWQDALARFIALGADTP